VYLENTTMKGEQVIGEDTAYIMNRLLRGVILNGTGKKALLENKENIGKTGTTENYRDILFAGLTEDFVSAVWTGYENAENPYALSGVSSADIWKNVFGEFADNFVSDASYPSCDSVIHTGYCEETGLPASKKCIVGGMGYYKSEITEYCKQKHKTPETEITSSYSTN
jgi:penicillin-binding protein 1A